MACPRVGSRDELFDPVYAQLKRFQRGGISRLFQPYEIGLQPSSTGEEGGKETGQAMSHYIIPGGRYAKAYAKLAATGFQLHWQSIPAKEQARGKKSSKTKFTCPKCGLYDWAKPNACLFCGEIYDDGQGHICLMVAVSWGATGEPAHAGTVACRSASRDGY
jgi:hypothetical protein